MLPYLNLSIKTKGKSEYVKLPSIATQLNNRLSCESCNIHKHRGCSNTILKNGSKIWYVLHNLIESFPTNRINREEFEILCITIRTIIKSLPCKSCANYSLMWYNIDVVNNTKLCEMSQFIYALWKHHDDVNRRIMIMNPIIVSKRLSWIDYKQQVEINKITCAHFTSG